MIGALARKFFGSANDRRIKGYQARIDAINALEPETAALSDEALKARTAEFRKQLAEGKTLDDILVPAFATVREAAKRTLGQRHFDVQLIGGMVLHEGDIAGATEQFGRWIYGGGKVMPGLVKRRALERAVFLGQVVP